MNNDCRSLTPIIPETDDPQVKYYLNSFHQLDEREQELAFKEEQLAVKEEQLAVKELQLKEHEKKLLEIENYLKRKNDVNNDTIIEKKLPNTGQLCSKNKKKKK